MVLCLCLFYRIGKTTVSRRRVGTPLENTVINGAFIRNKSVQVHEDTIVSECTSILESNIYDRIHEDMRVNEYTKYLLKW